MDRNKKQTLALLACFFLLAALAAVLARFPVNAGVTDAERTAAWENALYEAEQAAYAAGVPEKAVCPALVLSTAGSAEGDVLPGYVRVFSEEGEILSSYAAVSGSGGGFLLTLQSISRKGRVHPHQANPENLGEGEQWLLSPAEAEETAQEADDALPHLLLRLFRDGEDAGLYDFRLYVPDETDETEGGRAA